MLSRLGIREEMGKGSIVINPYNPNHVNPNSYDLTLDSDIRTYDHGDDFVLRVGEKRETIREETPDGNILLWPGKLYLASTVEWTETYYPWIPQLNGKSSLGRLGVRCHQTAGFGDVGFKGRWTIEIDVVQPVVLKIGMRICQISYTRLEGPYFDSETYDGRYQNQERVTAYIPKEE